MDDAAPRTTAERGWGKLLLALAAFLFLPSVPQIRALVPVEDTLLLLLPALAACCLVGWWAGGRFILAVLWLIPAAWVLSQPAVPGSFYNLVRGWSLLLAGGFGLVGLFGGQRAFFSRALTTAGLGLTIVLLMSLRGPLTPTRIKQAVAVEFERRNAETVTLGKQFVKQYPDVKKTIPQVDVYLDELDKQVRTIADTGAGLYPSLLLLESLVALALAWETYHRLSRTRIGAPLGHLKDFRFNDQLVWGLIAGLVIVFVPALAFLGGAGRNLLVFFGALYAIRGFGVLSWFMAPGALAVTMFVGFVMLMWPMLSPVALLGFILLALAAFGLGLGDTWADWRRRARPTT